jgi:hypothetical protein
MHRFDAEARAPFPIQKKYLSIFTCIDEVEVVLQEIAYSN